MINGILEKNLRRALLLLVCGSIGGCHASSAGADARAASPSSETIGLLLSMVDYQFYTTADHKEECPQGLAASELEQWQAQFPTLAARQAHFDRCGGVYNRGPDCEHVLAAPELVKDPLPYREASGRKSYGVNLDGTQDGRATATTCAHRKFVHPDGTQGIDNQYYRLLGCQVITHGGFINSQTVRERLTTSRDLRILLEILGVDDRVNDPDVEVVIYQGRDPLVIDGENKAVPWQSQRIEETVPPQRLRGRIVAGELITELADVVWRDAAFPLIISDSFYGPPARVRGSQLRLRLTEAGAEGLRTGYIDTADVWRARRFGVTMAVGSTPAFHEALHRLADGYKDPKTGACTALSSATRLEFVRAHIIHAREEQS